MDSNNPVFNPRTLDKMRQSGAFDTTGKTMTVEGSINKTGILVTLTILSSLLSWSYAQDGALAGLVGIALLVNFILGFVIIFKKEWSPTLAPIYAIIEGLVLGFISSLADSAYPGVVLNSFLLTFGILFMMLFLYRFKIIQATEKFKIGMSAALFAIMMTYLVDIIMGMFGHSIAMIHQSTPMAMIFSGVVIVVASLCFILDFDMIEKASYARAPAYMEWYAGFSVLLTIIWLYLEILRFLSRSRK